MNDYIDRENALDIVAHNNVNGEITLNRYDKIIDGIYEIPSANVAPVRHGHWIKISPAGIYECSKCGQNVMTSDIEAYVWCHGCGARMDGYENEID